MRPGREVLRKLLHMAFGTLAFSVPFLGPFGTTLLVLSALAFNAFVLPRVGGRRLWRPAEIERGRSVGMLSYPASVLVLVLVFWRRPEVAAATWGVLAFGDGSASLVGKRWGRARLPWNPDKTWLGTISYWVAGGLGATALLGWTLVHRQPAVAVDWAFLAIAAAFAAAFSAALESLPQELDDNVGVPILSGLFLFGLMSSEGYWASVEPAGLLAEAGVGLAVSLAFGLAAFSLRAIDLSGLVAGTLLGTAIYTFLGWRGFLVLAAFVLVGTAATRLGYREKAARRVSQESGGRRSARHALANAGVPASLALFAATTPHEEVLLPAFTAAFAAAASDTLESEIGQLWGGRTVLVTTFAPVRPGTDGAVSLVGTLAGGLGAVLFAVLGWALDLYSAALIPAVAAAGYLGSVVDSLLGATLERRRLLDNEAVNFTCTLAAALLAVLAVLL